MQGAWCCERCCGDGERGRGGVAPSWGRKLCIMLLMDLCQWSWLRVACLSVGRLRVIVYSTADDSRLGNTTKDDLIVCSGSAFPVGAAARAELASSTDVRSTDDGHEKSWLVVKSWLGISLTCQGLFSPVPTAIDFVSHSAMCGYKSMRLATLGSTRAQRRFARRRLILTRANPPL